MRTTISEEQAILSILSPTMRRAMLAAEPLNEEPDRKVIRVTPDTSVGTVVALIGRGLAEPQPSSSTGREHELTDKGLCVLHALNALRARGQAGTEDPRPARLARKLEDRASVHHLRAHTVSTVLTLLVRERIVTGQQAERLNAVAQELDKLAALR